MLIKKTVYSYIVISCFAAGLAAQSVYFTANVPGTVNNTMIWRVNPSTCQTCPVYDLPNHNLGYYPYELLMLPNGNIMIPNLFGGSGNQYNPITGTNIPFSITAQLRGLLLHPNGTIYCTAYNNNITTLHTFDPITSQFTLLGTVPWVVGELFYANGQMYGLTQVYPNYHITQINIANPSASTIAAPFFFAYTDAATTTSTGTTYLSMPGALESYNVATNTYTTVCTSGLPWFTTPIPWEALTTMPPGMPDPPCLCLTAASQANTNLLNVCIPNAASVPFSNSGFSDPNDVVLYILYTNPSDPLGSILIEQSTAVFAFAPPLVAGTNYYVKQVVGNDLNGSFDPTDPCLSTSAAVTVQWRAKPTLVSVAFDGPICDNDCGDATITLNGNSPFLYTWQVQQGGNILSSGSLPLYTQNATSTFQACVPAGVNGPVDLVICTVTDAFCTSP